MQLVLIALFAAISYLVLLFRIPYPAPVGQPFLHFGNAVVILAALLLGGWQGGLAGAIGMGINDLVYGYGFATIKTVILKFGIGLFAGLVARLGRKHPERSPRRWLGAASVVSLAGGPCSADRKAVGRAGLCKRCSAGVYFSAGARRGAGGHNAAFPAVSVSDQREAVYRSRRNGGYCVQCSGRVSRRHGNEADRRGRVVGGYAGFPDELASDVD